MLHSKEIIIMYAVLYNIQFIQFWLKTLHKIKVLYLLKAYHNTTIHVYYVNNVLMHTYSIMLIHLSL